jgi:hypothetical protein
MSLDDKCVNFHCILENLATTFIPVTFIKHTPRDKPWISPVVKSLINARWSAFRNGDFTLYSHLKMKVRREIRKAKICWTRRTADKNIWKAVNGNLGTREVNPINSLISQFESTNVAVEHISTALSSNFQKKGSTPDFTRKNSACEWNVNISEYAVMTLLMRLNHKKASFDIPSVLYREAAPFIAEPLAHLFKLSIRERHVPVFWKNGAVIPIPKNQKPTVHDLRPISILPTPAKILENVVLNSTRPYFMQNFDKCQFGFRSGSSTLCALLSLEECVSKHLDDPSTSGVVIVSYDLAKAFDKLPHDEILQRLGDLCFPLGFIKWIESYLNHRQQFVRLGVHTSDVVTVTSGVPQGSILGPLLFVTTINSFHANFDSHCVKYADDTTLCFPLLKDNIQNSMENIYRENERIIEWSRKIGLPINSSKSKCLTIKKTSNCPQPMIPHIPAVETLRILGFTFNSTWNMDAHINRTISIASRRLYALRILKPSLTKNEMVMMYNSLVRSHLEYCAPLLLGLSVTCSDKLERLQKRFHRLICGKFCRESCLEVLKDRRQTLSLRFLQKVSDSNHVLHHLLPSRLPSGRFRLPPRRTTRRCRSFLPLVCETYNVMDRHKSS